MEKSRKKSAVIEPLYKDGAWKDLEEKRLYDASLHVLNCPEFRGSFLPPLTVIAIYNNELMNNNIDLEAISLKKIKNPETEKILNRAAEKTLETVFNSFKFVKREIVDTLEYIEEEAEEEGNTQLKNDVHQILSVFKTSRSTKNLSKFIFNKLLLFDQLTIFSEFNDRLMQKLGKDFGSLMVSGMDEKAFETVLKEFEDYYPGFFEMLQVDQEFLIENWDKVNLDHFIPGIAFDGTVPAVGNWEMLKQDADYLISEEINLHLFKKKEIKKGVLIAKEFFQKLSKKEKERVLMLDRKFEKIKTFDEALRQYVFPLLDEKRLLKIQEKFDTFLKKNTFEDFIPFFELLQDQLMSKKDVDRVRELLYDVFIAQVRAEEKKSTAFFTMLFWVI